MKTDMGTEYRVIPDFRMSAKSAKACDDRMVTHLGIVSDMGAIHDEIVLTDPRASAASDRADVNRHVFSNLRACTDFETRRFTAEFSILRFTSKDGMRKDATVGSDSGSPDQRRMHTDLDTRRQFDLGSDIGERSDRDVGSQNRAILDAGGRMDVRHLR